MSHRFRSLLDSLVIDLTRQQASSRIVVSGSAVLGLKLVGLASGFLVNVVLARALGVEGYGALAVLLAAVGLLVVPATFGLQNLLVREVASASVVSDWATLHGSYRWGLRASLAASVLSLGLGLATAIALPAWNGVPIQVIGLAFLVLPLRSLVALNSGFLRGRGGVVLSQLPGIVGDRLCFLMAVVLAVSLFPETFSVRSVVWLILASAAVSLILSAILKNHLSGSIPMAVPDTSRAAVWRASALALVATDALFELQNQVDKLMLGSLSSQSEAGLYAGAQKFSSLIAFILVAANMVLAPRFADLVQRKDFRRAEALARFGSGVALATGGLVAIFYWSFGGTLLSILGSSFSAGKSLLDLLTLGQLVSLGVGSVGTILVMAGRERIVTWAVAGAAVLNIGLNLLLIPRVGALGASIATVASTSAWNLLLLLAVRRELGINPSIVGSSKRG